MSALRATLHCHNFACIFAATCFTCLCERFDFGVCASCRFGWTNSEEIPGSRGNAHLVQKCKTCSNVFTVEILSKPAQLSLSADDAERGAPVATFDCRTCEPAGYEAGDGWAVVGPSGAVFSDVTLDEDFCDYDEKAEASITVSGVKGAFVTGAAGKKK